MSQTYQQQLDEWVNYVISLGNEPNWKRIEGAFSFKGATIHWSSGFDSFRATIETFKVSQKDHEYGYEATVTDVERQVLDDGLELGFAPVNGEGAVKISGQIIGRPKFPLLAIRWSNYSGEVVVRFSEGNYRVGQTPVPVSVSV